MRPKRLLILSSEFPPGPGGIGTHAYQIAKGLNSGGWQVSVVAPQDYVLEEELSHFNKGQPFQIHSLAKHRFKFIQIIIRIWAIWQVISKFKPHMVIATGSRAAYISGVLLSLKKIPWVLIGHGSEFGAQKGWHALLMRLSGNRASAVICVSEYTLHTLRTMGITKPSTYVIHNGADHTLFYPLPEVEIQAFREKESVNNKFILLTVGNVSDRKGQEVVIRALPIIKNAFPNVIYWMAGLPQKQAELERLASDLGVADYIRFWGRVSQETLLKLYNACDLFLMTSRRLVDGDFEGFGIAVIEAALCGKSAVVSDESGLAEAVQDGITGCLVPQNDPQATADAVLDLAQDPEWYEKLSGAAYQHALLHQTWEKVGTRYEKVLESVIKKGSLCDC